MQPGAAKVWVLGGAGPRKVVENEGGQVLAGVGGKGLRCEKKGRTWWRQARANATIFGGKEGEKRTRGDRPADRVCTCRELKKKSGGREQGGGRQAEHAGVAEGVSPAVGGDQRADLAINRGIK